MRRNSVRYFFIRAAKVRGGLGNCAVGDAAAVHPHGDDGVRIGGELPETGEETVKQVAVCLAVVGAADFLADWDLLAGGAVIDKGMVSFCAVFHKNRLLWMWDPQEPFFCPQNRKGGRGCRVELIYRNQSFLPAFRAVERKRIKTCIWKLQPRLHDRVPSTNRKLSG